ncbi:putative Methionyl-tRNA formyltransferase [Magnetospirillum gryphiswaldense MSR-1 v2]|uniref:Methionyl-tRNA formyltransferase n=1 Tax=Magnetospirillum gryphiswaldense (strain DSM 6361 / JCM 21280 / NBRC 15271 / MSR-1) TaxID=431944 RepID=V6F827_MAGGM|nr:formyltransferase family protein [Magnetospirillum gryphiswaldense]CDL00648.1 putative Methionyl-tRNA formyltransferase [Magnetospirillum gryphiswaldense MSR-1 v2]
MRVLFLAAYTSRSRAYAQAMACGGINPDAVLYFGDAGRDVGLDLPVSADAEAQIGASLVDPRITLCETVALAGWPAEHCDAESVNSPELMARIQAHAPDLVIYSGYGGQLIKAEVLALGPFLHVHSGWLPDHRGSTTLYYSWIERGDCAASALLLDPRIDGGPTLLRKRFPPPPPGLDVDHVYDGTIRANVMVDVLQHVRRTGALPTPVPEEGSGSVYYVIHPVLKHLALLQNER